jgi:hypothetical protein
MELSSRYAILPKKIYLFMRVKSDKEVEKRSWNVQTICNLKKGVPSVFNVHLSRSRYNPFPFGACVITY